MGVCRPGFQLAQRSGADLAIQLFFRKAAAWLFGTIFGQLPKRGSCFFLKQTLIQHKIPFEIVQDSSFYSEKNIKALEHSKLQMENGQHSIHELVEV